MKLSIVIPAYNEQHAIGRVLNDLKEVISRSGLDYEVIVVDDGSQDNTAEVVRAITGVTLIQHSANEGYGAALKTGIRNASGELVLITDSDGTYPAKEIPKLLEYKDEYDMVVGARAGEGVRTQRSRKLAKYILVKLASYLVGSKIPDLNSGLRIFRRETVTSFLGILSSGFSFTTSVTLAHLSEGYSVKYVPIDYARREGKSKIHPIKDSLNFTILIVRIITYFNPLKVFLPLGVVLIIIGLGWLVYTLVAFSNVASATILTLLSGLQVIIIGVLADVIVASRRLK